MSCSSFGSRSLVARNVRAFDSRGSSRPRPGDADGGGGDGQHSSGDLQHPSDLLIPPNAVTVTSKHSSCAAAKVVDMNATSLPLQLLIDVSGASNTFPTACWAPAPTVVVRIDNLNGKIIDLK